VAVREAEVLDTELLGYPLLVRLWIHLACQQGRQESCRSLILLMMLTREIDLELRLEVDRLLRHHDLSNYSERSRRCTDRSILTFPSTQRASNHSEHRSISQNW
jgi:hypothetical protein